jgi:hypothetical protein
MTERLRGVILIESRVERMSRVVKVIVIQIDSDSLIYQQPSDLRFYGNV